MKALFIKNKKQLFKANLLLGQRFLTSRKVLAGIVQAACLSPNDTVLEVGPGKGILTKALLEKAMHVIAVEKDARLVSLLREKFSDEKRLTVVEGDVLALAKNKHSILSDTDALQKKYKIVANLPYYITSHFLRLFLSTQNFHAPTSMTLLVQKEMARRIVPEQNKRNKMNLLRLSVEAYGTPEFIQTVKPSAFSNPPHVDSAIVIITNISNRFFRNPPLGSRASEWGAVDEERFFALAKKAFSQKRKKLRNSLAKEFKLLEEKNKKVADEFSAKRPEELSLEDWKSLYLSIP